MTGMARVDQSMVRRPYMRTQGTMRQYCWASLRCTFPRIEAGIGRREWFFLNPAVAEMFSTVMNTQNKAETRI